MNMQRRVGLAVVVAAGICQLALVLPTASASEPEEDVAASLDPTQDDVLFHFDPRPEPGLPADAWDAGTEPDPQSDSEVSNIVFRIIPDGDEKGPLRDKIRGSIHAIKIRYFNDEYIDRAQVEPILRELLRSGETSTYTFPFWAEGLGFPLIEAYIHFRETAIPGYLLVWYKRVAYRDSDNTWWFSTSVPMDLSERPEKRR